MAHQIEQMAYVGPPIQQYKKAPRGDAGAFFVPDSPSITVENFQPCEETANPTMALEAGQRAQIT